jgi:hypothetical protein
MAYKGSISYLEAPFEMVDWTGDYDSPFRKNINRGKTFWVASGNKPTPVLRSKARQFASNQDPLVISRSIVFDIEYYNYRIDQLRCIIIGRDKPNTNAKELLNYIIVIARSPTEQGNGYIRVGVGALPDFLIRLDHREEVQVY